MIGQTLYVRGMNTSESDDEQSWDDTKLNEAYDKALQMANAEVAKRVAMSTNTKNKDKSKCTKKEKKSNETKNKEWKSGMPCRAVYEEDGLEYEALISRIIDDKECVVRFLGYDNSEIVAIDSLKPTRGNDERMRQIEQALHENDDGFGSQSHGEIEPGSDRLTSPGTSDQAHQQKKKITNKKKRNSHKPFGMSFTELPNLPMPNMSVFKNFVASDIPMPPPPPPISLSAERTDAEEQAISTMLLSWYMTGYYTGLYQGMKRARDNHH